MGENSEFGTLDENEPTYLGMKIGKIQNSDSEGIYLAPNGYVDRIGAINITPATEERERWPSY